MKNISTYVSLLFIILFSSCSISSNVSQSNYSNEQQDITYQQFYDDLSPYGQWIDYQNYGYVWMPAEQGFRPYYNNGQWVYTDYGWTWASNYSWGWAPFHYGRWLYDNAYGWMWVPGYEWAPAWVAWRSGGDYYGWAPLGPGMNINSNYGSGIPYDNWAFVPNRYITSPRINNYYVNSGQNARIINNTTVINNNTRVVNNRNIYTSGPSESDFERNTHEKIRQVKIVQRNTPGDTKVGSSTVSIYRPAVKEKPTQGEPFRPRKVENVNNVRARDLRNDDNKNTPNGNRNNNPQVNPAERVLPETNNNNTSPAPQKQTQPIRAFNQQKPVISNENRNAENETPETKNLNDTRRNDTRTQPPANNSPLQNNNQNPPNSNQPKVEPNRRTFPNQNNNQQQPAPVQNNSQQNTESNKRTFPNQNTNNQQQPPVRNNIPPAANPPAANPPAAKQQNNNFQRRENNNRQIQNNTQPNQKINQPAIRPQARPSTIMKNQNQEQREQLQRENQNPKEKK